MDIPPPTARQARIIWFAFTSLAVMILLVLVAAFVWGLGRLLEVLSPVLWPLAAAAILACLLDPVVDWFEQKGLSRAKSILSVFGLALLILMAVFGSVVPQIVSETRHLVERSGVGEWLNNNPENRLSNQPDVKPTGKPGGATNEPAIMTNAVSTPVAYASTNNVSLFASLFNRAFGTNTLHSLKGQLIQVDQKTLQSIKTWLVQAIPEIGRWLFGQVARVASWFGVLIGLALIPIYAFYFLLEKCGIQKRWKDYLPVRDSRFKEELIFILSAIEQYLIAFFRGQVLVAICESILYTIGFLSLGLNYAFLLGFAALLLLIVPFLGAIVLCIMTLTLTVVQYGDWLHPLLVLALFAVVQTLENAYISPKIMGNRVGLHPLAIIIAVMTGTTLLGGLLGGILAIPLAAALRVIMFHYVWKRTDETP